LRSREKAAASAVDVAGAGASAPRQLRAIGLTSVLLPDGAVGQAAVVGGMSRVGASAGSRLHR